ncbi:MAG: acyl-CoA desaturase [Legionellales bacterium]|nr:acyl-CoA desaturase [Legionellales bacterium]
MECPMIWTGLLDWSVGSLCGVTLVLTQIAIASVTLYLHRSQAHGGVKFHPALNHFFRFWLWFTTGMVTREWVAVHRAHHTHSDQEKDPHSPKVYGIKEIFFKGLSYYRKACRDDSIIEKFGQGTPDDWVERNVYSKHTSLGYFIMLGIELCLFGLPAFVIWGIQLLWIPLWAAGVINGVAHWWGYRNFETRDTARNIIPWAFWIGGEELHNNHHAFGASAKFSVKPWEFDIGWFYICVLSSLGLAHVRQTFPKMPESSDLVDLTRSELMHSLLKARWSFMSQYMKRVIRPVFSKEQRNHKAKGLGALPLRCISFIQDRVVISDRKQKILEHVLSEYNDLNIVYEFKQRLVSICHRDHRTKDFIEDLIAWCDDAQATGIHALASFSDWVRDYLPQSQEVSSSVSS